MLFNETINDYKKMLETFENQKLSIIVNKQPSNLSTTKNEDNTKEITNLIQPTKLSANNSKDTSKEITNLIQPTNLSTNNPKDKTTKPQK